jgi:hypothetical protein
VTSFEVPPESHPPAALNPASSYAAAMDEQDTDLARTLARYDLTLSSFGFRWYSWIQRRRGKYSLQLDDCNIVGDVAVAIGGRGWTH